MYNALLEFQALNYTEVNLFPAFTTFSQCLMASKYRAGKPGDFVTTSKNITVKSKQKIDTQGACSAPLNYPTLYKCTKQEVILTLSCKRYSDLQSSKKNLKIHCQALSPVCVCLPNDRPSLFYLLSNTGVSKGHKS